MRDSRGRVTRALFVTVAAHELYVPVNAWRDSMGPVAHITFNAAGPRNDDAILACAKGYVPDVIFYIGAHGGDGLPDITTFKSLRDIAPTIHYQSDVEDEAWFDLLKRYRKAGCFNLIVGQTGVKTDLIDMATLMAIDIKAFQYPKEKSGLCGFSGSCADLDDEKVSDERTEMLRPLRNYILYRPREPVGDYHGYVDFLKQCIAALNVSYTGSGKRHHVKWRCLEAAFADCALLEMSQSPLSDWFPKDMYFSYSSAGDAKRILQRTRLREFQSVAAEFSKYARRHYTPRQIFSGILDAL